ncbi:MAG: hypothetical protein WBF53_03205 [Litorimonas sp.]
MIRFLSGGSGEVPPFETYYPSEDMMDRKQRAFYKKLESALRRGDYLDVKGNISYLFVFAYKILSKWKSDGLHQTSDFLINLSEQYSHEKKFSGYCLHWAYDCLLGTGDYENYLEKTEPKQVFGTSTHFSNLRLNIQSHLEYEANPIDVLLMMGGRRTKFIKENQSLYKDKIIEVFDQFSSKNGSWFDILKRWMKNSDVYSHSLFNGAPLMESPKLAFQTYAFYAIYDHTDQFKSLSKQAENLAREEMGVPKIGEGWISETALFRRLEAEFSTTKVIQHGRPKWLGRQHFDVWFPHWKIAVEYHGAQHFEPVEFFGGEEAFMATVERDKRKTNLARRHGVKLIVVTEEEGHDEVVESIRSIQKARKVKAPL